MTGTSPHSAHSFYGVFVFRKRNPSRVFLLICSMLFMVQVGLSGEALADPPPWAPAHGYYKNKDKGKQKYKHEDRGDEYYADDMQVHLSEFTYMINDISSV